MFLRFDFYIGPSGIDKYVNCVCCTDSDREAKQFFQEYDDIQFEHGNPDLYEEYLLDDDEEDEEPEDFLTRHSFTGYDEIVDRLADRLRAIGFPLKCVTWPYGSNDDGSPMHVEDED